MSSRIGSPLGGPGGRGGREYVETLPPVLDAKKKTPYHLYKGGAYIRGTVERREVLGPAIPAEIEAEEFTSDDWLGDRDALNALGDLIEESAQPGLARPTINVMTEEIIPGHAFDASNVFGRAVFSHSLFTQDNSAYGDLGTEGVWTWMLVSHNVTEPPDYGGWWRRFGTTGEWEHLGYDTIPPGLTMQTVPATAGESIKYVAGTSTISEFINIVPSTALLDPQEVFLVSANTSGLYRITALSGGWVQRYYIYDGNLRELEPGPFGGPRDAQIADNTINLGGADYRLLGYDPTLDPADHTEAPVGTLASFSYADADGAVSWFEANSHDGTLHEYLFWNTANDQLEHVTEYVPRIPEDVLEEKEEAWLPYTDIDFIDTDEEVDAETGQDGRLHVDDNGRAQVVKRTVTSVATVANSAPLVTDDFVGYGEIPGAGLPDASPEDNDNSPIENSATTEEVPDDTLIGDSDIFRTNLTAVPNNATHPAHATRTSWMFVSESGIAYWWRRPPTGGGGWERVGRAGAGTTENPPGILYVAVDGSIPHFEDQLDTLTDLHLPYDPAVQAVWTFFQNSVRRVTAYTRTRAAGRIWAYARSDSDLFRGWWTTIYGDDMGWTRNAGDPFIPGHVWMTNRDTSGTGANPPQPDDSANWTEGRFAVEAFYERGQIEATLDPDTIYVFYNTETDQIEAITHPATHKHFVRTKTVVTLQGSRRLVAALPELDDADPGTTYVVLAGGGYAKGSREHRVLARAAIAAAITSEILPGDTASLGSLGADPTAPAGSFSAENVPDQTEMVDGSGHYFFGELTQIAANTPRHATGTTWYRNVGAGVAGWWRGYAGQNTWTSIDNTNTGALPAGFVWGGQRSDANARTWLNGQTDPDNLDTDNNYWWEVFPNVRRASSYSPPGYSEAKTYYNTTDGVWRTIAAGQGQSWADVSGTNLIAFVNYSIIWMDRDSRGHSQTIMRGGGGEFMDQATAAEYFATNPYIVPTVNTFFAFYNQDTDTLERVTDYNPPVPARYYTESEDVWIAYGADIDFVDAEPEPESQVDKIFVLSSGGSSWTIKRDPVFVAATAVTSALTVDDDYLGHQDGTAVTPSHSPSGNDNAAVDAMATSEVVPTAPAHGWNRPGGTVRYIWGGVRTDTVQTINANIGAGTLTPPDGEVIYANEAGRGWGFYAYFTVHNHFRIITGALPDGNIGNITHEFLGTLANQAAVVAALATRTAQATESVDGLSFSFDDLEYWFFFGSDPSSGSGEVRRALTYSPAIAGQRMWYYRHQAGADSGWWSTTWGSAWERATSLPASDLVWMNVDNPEDLSTGGEYHDGVEAVRAWRDADLEFETGKRYAFFNTTADEVQVIDSFTDDHLTFTRTVVAMGGTGGGGITQPQADARYLRESAADARYLRQSENLGDIGSASTARGNIGALSQTQVDARVTAGTLAPARTGNTDRWGQAKMLAETLIGAAINSGNLVLSKADGTNITLALPAGSGMADGVVDSATLDSATKQVTLETSTGGTIALNLSALAALTEVYTRTDADARFFRRSSLFSEIAAADRGTARSNIGVTADWVRETVPFHVIPNSGVAHTVTGGRHRITLTFGDGTSASAVGDTFEFQFAEDISGDPTDRVIELQVNSETARRLRIADGGVLRDMVLGDIIRYNIYNFYRAGSFWHFVGGTRNAGIEVDGAIFSGTGSHLAPLGIQNGGIGATHLAVSSVTPSKIQSTAVTEPKLANNAVATRAVVDRNITGPKIALDAIEDEHIGDDQIGSEHLKDDLALPGDPTRAEAVADADGDRVIADKGYVDDQVEAAYLVDSTHHIITSTALTARTDVWGIDQEVTLINNGAWGLNSALSPANPFSFYTSAYAADPMYFEFNPVSGKELIGLYFRAYSGGSIVTGGATTLMLGNLEDAAHDVSRAATYLRIGDAQRVRLELTQQHAAGSRTYRVVMFGGRTTIPAGVTIRVYPIMLVNGS